jgi:hypothetical protein
MEKNIYQKSIFVGIYWVCLGLSRNAKIIDVSDKIIIMYVNVRQIYMTNPLVIAFKRIFCNHDSTFSYRKYNDFDFFEYDKCMNCEKVVRYLRGFDESIRG